MKKSMRTTDREKETIRGGKIQADKRGNSWIRDIHSAPPCAILYYLTSSSVPLSPPVFFHVKIEPWTV